MRKNQKNRPYRAFIRHILTISVISEIVFVYPSFIHFAMMLINPYE